MSISNIFITFVLLIFLIYITCYLISILQVFIWYQKLDNIASKYTFVIQNYGGLTELEKEELYKDLDKDGFNLENIIINEPKYKSYGELAEFSISYTVNINEYSISMSKKEKNVNIFAKKNFYITK